MEKFTHHFLLANKKLSSLHEQIESILRKVENDVLSKLQTISVDVVIMHCPFKTIPELGIVGSYNREAKLIEIALDVENDYLKKNLEEEIRRTFAHEYMHVVREEHIQFEKGTLLDAIISEGLTQSFEIEVNPNIKPAIYATNLSDTEIVDAFEKLKLNLSEKNYDYNTWFFGNETEKVKRWTGYSLGYWLVQKKIKKEGRLASELVALNSADFLE